MAVLNFDIKSVTLPGGSEAKSVFLSGSIDASTNQLFETQLTGILTAGTNKVLLVLTNVKYINSTGLGTIVKCVDTFREKNGDIKLVGVPAKVIALFEMLGLLALFETYDNLDTAVASFGAAAGAAEVKPKAQFPINFKHPKSGLGLSVAQPGRFKDPRSGDYFNVTPEGTIEFYEMTRVKVVEVKLPTEPLLVDALISSTEAILQLCHLPPAVAVAMTAAISEVWPALCANTNDSDTCTVILAGDSEKMQVGLLSYGSALDPQRMEPALRSLRGQLDDLKLTALPARGQLLTLAKKKA
jgi:anti-anti-sigma factor